MDLYQASQEPWDIDKNKGISGAQRRLDLQNRLLQLIKLYDSWPTYELIGTSYSDVLPTLLFHLYPNGHYYIRTIFKDYYHKAVKEGGTGRQWMEVFV